MCSSMFMQHIDQCQKSKMYPEISGGVIKIDLFRRNDMIKFTLCIVHGPFEKTDRRQYTYKNTDLFVT